MLAILRQMMAQEMGYDRPPYTDVLNSLKDKQQELQNQQTPIDWSFVRLHLGRLEHLKRNSDFFYDVLTYIVRLFDVYRCREFSVLADTFQLLCFVFEYSASSFRKAKIMTDLMKSNASCCENELTNYVAKLMKMPYKNNNSPYELMYDAIQMYIVSLEDKLLKHLLEYGVMYIPLGDHKSTWAHCRQRMSILL